MTASFGDSMEWTGISPDSDSQKSCCRKVKSDFGRWLTDRLNGVLVHINGIVHEANDAACRMFGYSHDELIGMTAK